MTADEERWERFEKTREFLLQQQAQFRASLQAQREEFDRRTERHDAEHAELTGLIARIARVVDVGFKRHEEAHREFEEQQRKTDERLNVLINVVERYFSNGQR